jgi:hypothetical protein
MNWSSTSEPISVKTKRPVPQPSSVGEESPVVTLAALADVLREAALEVVWRQWGAVGGAVSVKHRAESLVDPEALVLVSAALAPRELRLADVLSDWVLRNSDLLSVQRMRNLAGTYPAAVQARLAGIARIALVEGKDHRWKALVADAHHTQSDLPRRGNKPRASRVRVSEAAALMLRLRLAFGVGIKADLLTLLLTAETQAWTSVSMMASATSYTVAAVRKAVGDLTESRLVDARAGTRTEYSAARPRWQALLGITTLPSWRDWQGRFRFVVAFLAWADDAERRPLTSYVLASRGRDLIEAHPEAFRWSGDEDWSAHLVATEPNVLVPAIHRLASWMDEAV